MSGSLSRLLHAKSAPMPQVREATTMTAFLPPPDKHLYGEFALGSLTFPRESYAAFRETLIAFDDVDEEHAILSALKALLDAPVKTTLFFRSGYISTFAKREKAFMSSPYVALYWNDGDKDAYEKLYEALCNIAHWMAGERQSSYPSPPHSAAATTRVTPLREKNAFESLGKPKTRLDFSGEVLRKTGKGPPIA